jgi:hypothetical protein
MLQRCYRRPVQAANPALRFLLFGLLALALAPAAARADDALPVPRGTRTGGASADGALISGQTFRPTVEHLGQALDQRGIAYHQVGPYRSHGLDVVRLIPDDARAPWLAIHVWRASGKTWISFVKRAP